MREHGGILKRFSSFVRWLLLAVLVCAAGLVVFRQIVTDRLDEEIRARLESMFASHYTDMEVRISGARRIEGKGIEVRGLSIRSLHEETAYRDLLYIDELFLECRADLHELLLERPEVRRLIVRRMKLRATCYPDGKWNLASLLPPPNFGGTVPTIVLEDSMLELQDLCRQSRGVWALRNIDMQAELRNDSAGRRQWVFGGTMLGDHFKNVQLQGVMDPEQGNWSAGGTIDGLEMSQRLFDVLPNDVAKYASLLATLRARAHFEFRLGHITGAPDPIYAEVHGHLAEGVVDDPRLPLPWTDVEADVYCTNQDFRLENVTARSGPTTLELNCRCENFLSSTPQLQLNASVRQMPLDERLYEALPEHLHDDWHKFSPAGTVDASVDVKLIDNQFLPKLTVNCRDVSFAYEKFPLRMRQGNGVIQLVGDMLHVRDFTAMAGSQLVHFVGQFQNPGPQSTGWLDMRTAGPIALDQELVGAMNEPGRKIYNSLHPTGGITLIHGRMEKKVPDEKPHTRWEFALNDCSVQYDRFPYAIHKITGRLVVENRRWDFYDLRGYHGSSQIWCNGAWVPLFPSEPGGELIMHFKCWDVPLNDSLRNAVGKLNANSERFWDSMRPRGTADFAQIDINFNSLSKQMSYDVRGEKWLPGQAVDGRSISIHPTWFPLQMDDCTGKVRFVNGQFSLEEVTARRGKSHSLVELAGHGRMLPEGRWEVVLTRLNADSLQLDHELVDALPAAMRSPIRQLKYRGALGLNGNAWFRGGLGQPLFAGWDVLLDVEQGALENELKLEHIYGGIRLTGGKDANGFRSNGVLEIDSLMTHGVQLAQVQGPFWVDATQLILGSQASVVKPGGIPQQVTARVMGGTVGVDAHVILNEQLPFAVNVSLSNADITQLARSFHTQRHDISGKVFALVRLKGAKAGLHTLQGTGQLRLREADIYELPVMAQLLSKVNPNPPETTGFTSADVDFRIQGEQIYMDRVDFIGDILSLKGNGWMDLNRQVNLEFYALVGREEFQLPVIRTLLAEASRNILLIQVKGTLDNPDVIKKPLPELDDTLQRLFPETAARAASR